jgi:hypothetical protein
MRHGHFLPASLSLLILVVLVDGAGGKSPTPLPGARAVVVDDRYSVLREQPDLQGRIVQRLGRGRVVGLLATVRNQRGERFHRLAISRKRSGWIYELAIVRTGSRRDAARMIDLIEETPDDFTRISLARICQREFRGMDQSMEAGRLIATTAPRVAAKLTQEARRRIGDPPPADRRSLFLSFVGLDRYNRIGVLFDYDEQSDQLVFSRIVRR